MSQNLAAVVIDNGSDSIKAGIAGDSDPKCWFQTIVAKVNKVQGIQNEEIFIGNEATIQIQKEALSLSYPIENGLITNWEDVERIWKYTFVNQLKVNPELQPVLMTEMPQNPKANREKMTEILFETFQIPSFYVAKQSILALYAAGRLNGIVLDCGQGVSHAVPVNEGYSISNSILTIDLAGQAITDWLNLILQELGQKFSSSVTDQLIVRDIKEKLCFVALDYEEELKKYKESTQQDKIYQLPDGSNLKVQTQQFRAPEILFQPNFIGMEILGIQEIIYKSIMRCGIEIRDNLYGNIVLAGGTTLIPGISERINKEIISLAPVNQKIKIVTPQERKCSAWIGGSILSALGNFQAMWITKGEYDEQGPAIVHKKCF